MDLGYKENEKGYDQIDLSFDGNMLFDNLPEIMRPHKVADLLGLSVKTIYDWKYRGKTRNIPSDLFLKLNRSLYIRTEVLKRLVTSN
ncbi:MAG: hypothetical protein CME62_12425 [Halobacteriovoraceae bacterium]|nr:hypothetical protein [Halobacteriovoraceae bacterium]